MKILKSVIISLIMCGSSTHAMDCLRQFLGALCCCYKQDEQVQKSYHERGDQYKSVSTVIVVQPFNYQREFMRIAGEFAENAEECPAELQRIEGYLKEKRVDINARYEDGQAVLHKAAENKRNRLVELLLDYKVDIAARDRLGRIPEELAGTLYIEAVIGAERTKQAELEQKKE
jgi:hypothetical protein